MVRVRDFLLPALMCALLLSGCSKPQEPQATSSPALVASPTAEIAKAGLEVKLPGGQDLSFEPSTGFFDPRGDIKEGTISVANYPFKMEPMAANSVQAIAREGQLRLAFALKSLPDGNYTKPITPGEYPAASILFVEVYSFENGSQKHSAFDHEQGKVTITEVTDSQISGSIDVTGDNGAVVKGQFTAQTTKKS